MQGLEPYRNSVNIFWLNKYGLIVYLSVVLSQCSVGSLLPCADLDCHATSGGVSICVCILCVDLLSWPVLSFCLSPFLSYLPTPSYLCSVSNRELILEVTFPVEVHGTLIHFSCTALKKKKKEPVLFVVHSVYLLRKWEKYNRALVSHLIFVLLCGPLSPLTWRPSWFSVPRGHSSRQCRSVGPNTASSVVPASVLLKCNACSKNSGVEFMEKLLVPRYPKEAPYSELPLTPFIFGLDRY